MTREQLLHAIRAACDVLGVDEVLVVGSQAILASRHDTELPAESTRSQEADIASLTDEGDASSHLLAGILGEDSSFHNLFGFFVDGVGANTALLPAGWRARAIRLSSYSLVRRGEVAGLCPDAADLCVSKLCAFRERDRSFVAALVASGVVAIADLLDRLATVPGLDPRVLYRVSEWLDTLD